MIKQETIFINGRELIKTYSDNNKIHYSKRNRGEIRRGGRCSEQIFL